TSCWLRSQSHILTQEVASSSGLLLEHCVSQFRTYSPKGIERFKDPLPPAAVRPGLPCRLLSDPSWPWMLPLLGASNCCTFAQHVIIFSILTLISSLSYSVTNATSIPDRAACAGHQQRCLGHDGGCWGEGVLHVEQDHPWSLSIRRKQCLKRALSVELVELPKLVQFEML
ncbi:hypothetical protein HPG69_005253, partial [Diceros bicornis minor]